MHGTAVLLKSASMPIRKGMEMQPRFVSQKCTVVFEMAKPLFTNAPYSGQSLPVKLSLALERLNSCRKFAGMCVLFALHCQGI